jgi:hypothetical protein
MHSGEPANSGDEKVAKLDDVPFAANDVRLSPREWFVATILVVGAFWLVPATWPLVEPVKVGPDYRVPYALGYDYWNYERVCRKVCAGDKVLLFGDSVMWGEYVDSDSTLAHCLNELSGGDRFANLSIDGIHPVAMFGLLQQYGGAIRGQRVILNCNLLWMTSARRDLSAEKESPFHHPDLVPQFQPWIPCYRASVSERLGIVVGRNFRFLSWANHLRIAYFANQDLPAWTIDHPCDNPAGEIAFALPSPDERPEPQPDRRPWTEKGIRPITPDWVALDASLQWRFFQRTVRLLRERDNDVFVVIGPLNEHMLTEEGRRGHAERTRQVAAWHAAQGVPHYVAPLLPSETYADLSHPTAQGYALLAQRLFNREEFTEFRDRMATSSIRPRNRRFAGFSCCWSTIAVLLEEQMRYVTLRLAKGDGDSRWHSRGPVFLHRERNQH